MKIFSILVFAPHAVSGMLSETSVENEKQNVPYIIDGKVIETGEQYAEAFLENLSRRRGSSVGSFVQKSDIYFAKMYRLGLPNAREYLKAEWDYGRLEIIDGKVELNVALKDILAKFGMPDAEHKAVEAARMKWCLLIENDNNRLRTTMLESVLFIHGKVPFAEYSAIWNAATGRSDGPPESDYTRDQIFQVTDELNKMLTQRPLHELLYKKFEERYNDFWAVFRNSKKRPAEGAPVQAPAAKRARPTAVCEDAQSSFQKLLCEHAQFQEEIASLKTQLQTKNQEIDQMKVSGGARIAQLQSDWRSLQADLRAELQGKINALSAQNEQLQRENAGLRQQRPQVMIKTEPQIKQEVKQEHFETKPEPQQ